MSDQLKKIMIGCGAGFVILLIILFVLSSCQGSTTSFEKIQTRMIKIAKSYYEDHEDKLPTEDKDTDEYTLKQMVSSGAMEEISEQMDDESIKCDGGVTVTNNNGYYLYTVELDCGDAYSTETLVDKVKEDNLVESGHGLYELNNEYVFKGEANEINNFVKFNNETYKIIGINANNELKLLQTKGTSQISSWDEHYNSTTGDDGVNIYYQDNDKSSTIKEELDNFYDEHYTEDSKTYISTETLCTGSRSENDTTKDGSTECAQTLANQKVGLISVYEIMRASIDSECLLLSDKTCTNYNWIFDLEKTTWTINTVAGTSNKAYKLIANDSIISSKVYSTSSYLAVITIDGKVNYTSGTGTEEDPYIIGENKEEK